MRAVVDGLTQASLTGVDAWETSTLRSREQYCERGGRCEKFGVWRNVTRDQLEAKMGSERHKAPARKNSGLDTGLIGSLLTTSLLL